jgi:hypothetical protein
VYTHHTQHTYSTHASARARSRTPLKRDNTLPLLVAAAGITFALALRPDIASRIPWQSVVGIALLLGVVGGAVASAMRVGDLYGDTLARSSWPPPHDSD